MDSLGYDVEAMKRAAMSRGWPRYRVAREAKLGAPTVNRLFRGERVRESTVKKVAEALGLDLADLVIRNGEAVGTVK